MMDWHCRFYPSLGIMVNSWGIVGSNESVVVLFLTSIDLI